MTGSVRGEKVARKYVNNFDYQWDNRRNTRNAYTTTYANFRVARWSRDEDGILRRTYVTVRRPVTKVDPALVLPGPFWEDD